MKPWFDQKGNLVTFDQFVDMLAEAILANLIAFDRAGIRRGEVQQIIGPDGGTLIGGGALLQTPVENRMTDEEGHALLESYKKLLGAYDRGEIAESILAEIANRNKTENKAEMLRKHIGGKH